MVKSAINTRTITAVFLFVIIAFRNITTTAKQAVYRRNDLAKIFGAHVIMGIRVDVSRESREERAFCALSSLVFLWLLSENTESNEKTIVYKIYEYLSRVVVVPTPYRV